MTYQTFANALRALSIDSIEKANSGHPGLPLGFADVATILWQKFLKFDPQNPQWPNRDRFILSAGHGSALLYSLLYLNGYKDISIDDLKNFRQKGAKTAGHPEFGELEGIETTTGPLGQGIANAVGMAIAEQLLSQQYGSDIIDHKTYVVAGDGCLMEGISYEAISLAGHLKLRKLVLLFDNNSITIDGSTSLTTSEDMCKRFEACGWHTIEIDGHDYDEITEALEEIQEIDKPSFISCKTIIGYGAPNKKNTSSVHGSALGHDEYMATKKELDWPYDSFVIPEHILDGWRKRGQENHETYKEWKKRFDSQTTEQKKSFNRRLNKTLAEGWNDELNLLKKEYSRDQKACATREASEDIIRSIAPHIAELVGGSADLSGSNKTKVPTLKPLSADTPDGRYIYYGIREHAMGAIMNGLALYGTFIPFAGTFLVFSDYCRPAIRLAALMKQRVIYVGTHDSIGLGEDGPTHQPVEHLASLRAIPDLYVYRPADGIETIECWEQSLLRKDAPSILSLSRQSLPMIRGSEDDMSEQSLPKGLSNVNLSSLGAYILYHTPYKDPQEKRDITLVATGSEVSIALQAAKKLEEKNLTVVVVSVPCLDIFDQQEKKYKDHVLGHKKHPHIFIEAGISQCWHKYMGDKDTFIGVETFGISAPYQEVYQHFHLTPEHIYQTALSNLK